MNLFKSRIGHKMKKEVRMHYISGQNSLYFKSYKVKTLPFLKYSSDRANFAMNRFVSSSRFECTIFQIKI